MGNQPTKRVCTPYSLTTLAVMGLLVLAGSSLGQKTLIPERFLQIVPGISTREDVEKIYRSNGEKGNFVRYETPELSVGVQYSTGECSSGASQLRTPSGTVEQVYYNWQNDKRVRLSTIVHDLEKFNKSESGDVVGHVYYINEEFGIVVVYDGKLRSVIDIGIKPSQKIVERYRCEEGTRHK